MSGPGSVLLQASKLHHLGPLLSFVGDELGKVRDRAKKRLAAEIRHPTSAAISAERSARPSAQRYAIAILRPSLQPSSRSLCTKAAVHWLCESCVLAPKNPIVGNLA